eukprot:SAG11_NODE_6182_length_1370_cov_1.096774_1_plen_71_part_00
MAVPRYFEVRVDLPALDLYTNFTTMALDLRPGGNFVAQTTAVLSIMILNVVTHLPVRTGTRGTVSTRDTC